MKSNAEVKAVFEAVKEYILLRKKHALFIMVDKVSHTISGAIGILIAGIFAILSLLFFSVAIGFLLADKMDSNFYAGFFIVAGFYLLITLIVFFARKNILEKPLLDMLIRHFFKERNKTAHEN